MSISTTLPVRSCGTSPPFDSRNGTTHRDCISSSNTDLRWQARATPVCLTTRRAGARDDRECFWKQVAFVRAEE